MKILFFKTIVIVCFLISTTVEAIDLTVEEKEFIASTPKVTVAMMPDFTPFTYYIENTPVGFEHDLLKMISEKTGLYF